MKNPKGQFELKKAHVALAVVITLVIFACRNPLLVDVEETIAKVVEPPEVTAIFPAQNALDVPINTQVISVTFSKNVDERTVKASSFYVAMDEAESAGIAGTRSVQNETISFEPSEDLGHNTTYRVVITTELLDVDGNSLAETYQWSFTTGLAPDTTAPSAPLVVINDGDPWATSATVTLTLTAEDDRGLAQMNVSNSASFSDANWTTYQSPYEWTLPGDGSRTVYAKFKDGAGNQSGEAQASIDVDTTAPAITVFVVDGGKSATKNDEVTLGLVGEDTESSSGVVQYRIRFQGDVWPTTWGTLDAHDSALVPAVALPSGLASDDTVTFEAQVRDFAGNVSITGSATIIYDLTAPTIDTGLTSPAAGELDVPYDTSVVHLYFNEEINLATITPLSFFAEDSAGSPLGGEFQFADYGDITFGRVSLTGLSLEPNTDYFVTATDDVQDVAGNALGETSSWFFQTGFATDTTAPTGTVSIDRLGGSPIPDVDTFMELPGGTYATNHPDLVLSIVAIDEYNLVYGMNFWGEGLLDGAPSPFEDPTNGWEPYADEKSWVLDNEERTHNLWYRFQDSRGNKTPDPPGYFSVVLDISAPTIASVEISNATTDGSNNLYVNNPLGEIELVIGANDIGGLEINGSGIYQMRFSNDGTFDPDGLDWLDWSPLYNEWTLDLTPDEQKTLSVELKDYLGNSVVKAFPDPAGDPKLFYDTTAPEIAFDTGDPADPFDTGDVLITKDDDVTQTVTVTDAVIGTLVGTVGTDITFLWEQVSGPGTITFTDETDYLPLVTASDDGTYLLKVTATDPAGNSASGSISYTRDTDAPDPIGSVTAADGYYTTTGYPEFIWLPVSGADYYHIETRDSLNNLVGGTPIDILQTSYSPTVQLPEWEDVGLVTVTVTPYDFAGNPTAPTGGNGTATVFTDTIAPAITNDGQLFLRNAEFTIDYGDIGLPNPGGAHGSVTENGSGIASALWQEPPGNPGTLGIGSSTELNTTIDASAHGYYGLTLTVTDDAGNSGSANFTVNWDIIGPNAPQVAGIDHTPATQPTWSWSSGGGGGSGNYMWQLMDPDGVTVLQSGQNAVTTFIPSPALDPDTDGDEDGMGDDEAGHTYELRVWEQDGVGNWSTSYGSHSIWVDSGYTAPPEVTVDGPLVQTGTSIKWDWSSGAAQATGATYRWRVLRDDLTTPLVEQDVMFSNYPDGTASETYTYTASTSNAQDHAFTIEVEEYYNNIADPPASDWIGKYGTAVVRVDLKGPDAPIVQGISSDRTTDITPSWSWSTDPNSDGIGYYRYRLDNPDLTGAPETTGTVYTAPSQPDGNHTLYVQEQDNLGNWGTAGSFQIEVDTTPPQPPVVTLDDDSFSISTTSVPLTVVVASETDPAVEMSIYDYNPAGWKDWQSVSVGTNNRTVVVTSVEENKRVWVRLQDSLGNISSYDYDDIIVDWTAPNNLSVVLNSGDDDTPSRDVWMDLGATDNYSAQANLQVQYRYDNGTEYTGTYATGTWQPFAGRLLGDVDFAARAEEKVVEVRFRDQAGNESDWVSDSIYMQIAQPTYAWKGYDPRGASRVYYNPVNEPAGANTTDYDLYYGTDPGFDPNADLDKSGRPDGEEYLTRAGNTTSTSYGDVTGLPTGELLYFWIRPYNADSGGDGAFSTANVLGFSSDVTVVYNDRDDDDLSRARLIQSLLTERAFYDEPYVGGELPEFTVTLLPESLIPEKYDEGNMIYGDPVIITTGTRYSPETTYDGQVRNIAATERPIVAMGEAGAVWLLRIASNFEAWRLNGTPPVNIAYSKEMLGITGELSATTRPYHTSDSIWYEPMRHTELREDPTSIFRTEIFTRDERFPEGVDRRLGAYMERGLNPEDGAIYAGDPSFEEYFPVVRQGRYLFYGFFEVADSLDWIKESDDARMGALFFVNLIEQMRRYW